MIKIWTIEEKKKKIEEVIIESGIEAIGVKQVQIDETVYHNYLNSALLNKICIQHQRNPNTYDHEVSLITFSWTKENEQAKIVKINKLLQDLKMTLKKKWPTELAEFALKNRSHTIICKLWKDFANTIIFLNRNLIFTSEMITSISKDVPAPFNKDIKNWHLNFSLKDLCIFAIKREYIVNEKLQLLPNELKELVIDKEDQQQTKTAAPR